VSPRPVPIQPQSANYPSLLTYYSPAKALNRDRFGKEIHRLLTKIPGSLPSVQVNAGRHEWP